MLDDINIFVNLVCFEFILVILLNLKLKILKFVEYFFGYYCRISLGSVNFKYSIIIVRKIIVCFWRLVSMDYKYINLIKWKYRNKVLLSK